MSLKESFKSFLGKHGEKIIFGTKILTRVATPFVAARDTKKYLYEVDRIENQRLEKAYKLGEDINKVDVRLTKKEKAKLVAKCYIPTAAIEVIGLASDFAYKDSRDKTEAIAADVISASASSAAITNEVLKNRSTKVENERIRHEIADKKLENAVLANKSGYETVKERYNTATDQRKMIIFDDLTKRYLLASPDEIRGIQDTLDEQICGREGSVLLADWYYQLMAVDPTIEFTQEEWNKAYKMEWNYIQNGRFELYIEAKKMDDDFVCSMIVLPDPIWIR